MARETLRLRTEEVGGELRNLHEGLHNLCSSTIIIRAMKLLRFRQRGTCSKNRGGDKFVQNFSSQNPNRKNTKNVL
jgi:hypothetical protein